MSEWQTAPREKPLLPGDMVSYGKDNAIILGSSLGIGLVCGTIGFLTLYFTEDPSTTTIIVSVCLMFVGVIGLSIAVVFCICKGEDACECR
mmetsp:Transcript_14176/g.24288  ORF Transcript_14176/g.24288 Transcript_14176/m.24288 type:complete len:91 (-) Transcript_14176:52-324(-)